MPTILTFIPGYFLPSEVDSARARVKADRDSPFASYLRTPMHPARLHILKVLQPYYVHAVRIKGEYAFFLRLWIFWEQMYGRPTEVEKEAIRYRLDHGRFVSRVRCAITPPVTVRPRMGKWLTGVTGDGIWQEQAGWQSLPGIRQALYDWEYLQEHNHPAASEPGLIVWAEQAREHVAQLTMAEEVLRERFYDLEPSRYREAPDVQPSAAPDVQPSPSKEAPKSTSEANVGDIDVSMYLVNDEDEEANAEANAEAEATVDAEAEADSDSDEGSYEETDGEGGSERE